VQGGISATRDGLYTKRLGRAPPRALVTVGAATRAGSPPLARPARAPAARYRPPSHRPPAPGAATV